MGGGGVRPLERSAFASAHIDLAPVDFGLLRRAARLPPAFADHRALDGGASHAEEEWQAVEQRVGELIWLLEVAAAPQRAAISHSDEARQPPGG